MWIILSPSNEDLLDEWPMQRTEGGANAGDRPTAVGASGAQSGADRGFLMSEPHCPKCGMPMRLMRVLPSMLPPETGVETRVFACGECWTTVSRTAREIVGIAPFRA